MAWKSMAWKKPSWKSLDLKLVTPIKLYSWFYIVTVLYLVTVVVHDCKFTTIKMLTVVMQKCYHSSFLIDNSTCAKKNKRFIHSFIHSFTLLCFHSCNDKCIYNQKASNKSIEFKATSPGVNPMIVRSVKFTPQRVRMNIHM